MDLGGFGTLRSKSSAQRRFRKGARNIRILLSLLSCIVHVILVWGDSMTVNIEDGLLSSDSAKITISGDCFAGETGGTLPPTAYSAKVYLTLDTGEDPVSGVFVNLDDDVPGHKRLDNCGTDDKCDCHSQLVYSFTRLSRNTAKGVTINDIEIQGLTLFNTWSISSATKIGKIAYANPKVTSVVDQHLSSDSSRLTISGKGFHSQEPAKTLVTLKTPASGNGDPIQATTEATTLSSITILFTHLAPTNAHSGVNLETDKVTITNTWSYDTDTSITKVVAALPKVEQASNVLSSDSSKLTVLGKGFDATASAKNAIIFANSDTIKALYVSNSKTTLTTMIVSFTHLAPTDGGEQNAQVIVSKTWSTPPSQVVAKVAAAKPVIEAPVPVFVLSSDSYRLTIQGKGFDATTTAKNVILFVVGKGEQPKGIVERSALTSLVVSFTHLAPTNANTGSLEHLQVDKLIVSNTWSDDSNTDVAKIVAALPKLTASNVLSSDSLKLTVLGKGFDATASEKNAIIFENSDTIKALYVSNSKTTLTTMIVSFTHLAPTDEGDLRMRVRVSNTWSAGRQAVTKIVAALPKLTASNLLSSDSLKLTVLGKGFDATASAKNAIIFENSDTIKALYVSNSKTTLTTMIVSFTHLAPTDEGDQNARVRVSNTWSTNPVESVTRIVAAKPEVDAASSPVFALSSDSYRLTIQGKGFDATTTAKNVILFVNGKGEQPKGIVDRSALTSLVVSFTHLAPTNANTGSLEHLQVDKLIVSSTWSDDGDTDVAKVVAAKPSITFSDGLVNLPINNALEHFVNGRGFDATDSTQNILTFTADNTDAEIKGIVENNGQTLTRLFLSFSTFTTDASNNGGNIYATVTVSKTWSSPVTQIFDAETNPAEVNPSTLALSSDSSLLTIQGSNFDSSLASRNTVEFNATTHSINGESITVASSAELVVAFHSLFQLNRGSVFARVLTADGQDPDYFVVAKVVPTRPKVDSNENLLLSSDTSKLTVEGTGFASIQTSLNTFRFGESSVRASAAKSYRTMLVMSFTHLAPTNNAQVEMRPIVSGTWSTISDTTVCTLYPARPTLTTGASVLLSSDSATITIEGKGFDALNTAKNVASLTTTKGDSVTGLTSESTMTRVILRFAHLSPTNAATNVDVDARIIVSKTWSSLTTAIAKVAATRPTIIGDHANILSSDSLKLTVVGKGFDATASEKNVLEFSITKGPNVVGERIDKTTLTQLQVSFTHLAPINIDGLLSSQVVISGTWSLASPEEVHKIVAARPSVDIHTVLLSSDSEKLTISGRGFDAAATASNVLLFDNSQRSRGSVEESTLTRLVVSFTYLSPLTSQDFHSNVRVHSTWSASTTTKIAKIYPAHPKLATGTLLSSDSLKLTISGTGFEALETTENVCEFGRAQGPEIRVTPTSKSSMTSLIVEFTHLSPRNSGIMKLRTVIFSTWSVTASPLLTVVSAVPDVNVQSSLLVSSDASKLTISGKGFEATESTTNVVVLSPETNSMPAVIASVSGNGALVMNTTLTRLVVSFTHLSPLNRGTLNARVEVMNTWSSESVKVSKIASARPRLMLSQFSTTLTDPVDNVAAGETLAMTNEVMAVLSTDSSKITVLGRGFEATHDASLNKVLMFAQADESDSLTQIGNDIKATAVTATRTSMVLSFTHLSPTNGLTAESSATNTGAVWLFGLPVVASTWSYARDAAQSYAKSNYQRIRKLLPSVQFSNASMGLSTDSSKLTIFGMGFDAGDTDKNVVSFSVGSGDAVKAVMHRSTHSSLVMSFTHLAPTNTQGSPAQNLSSALVISGTWSAENLMVATLLSAKPTVDQSVIVLSSDAAKLTITGRGFDATRTFTNNVVSFTSTACRFDDCSSTSDHISGYTAQSTLTTLIVSFYKLSVGHTSPSDGTASMSANVAISGIWSSSAKVAKIFAADPVVTSVVSALSSDTSLLTISGTGFDAHATNVSVDFTQTAGAFNSGVQCDAISPNSEWRPTFYENKSSCSCNFYDELSLACNGATTLEPLSVVTGATFRATRTQLIISFFHLNPSNVRGLSAVANVLDRDSGAAITVSKIVYASPSITSANRTSFTTCDDTLTVRGAGFTSSSLTGNNSTMFVLLLPGAGPGINGTVTQSTRSHLIVSFSNPDYENVGSFDVLVFDTFASWSYDSQWPVLSTGKTWSSDAFEESPVWTNLGDIVAAEIGLTSDEGTDANSLATYRQLYTSSPLLTITGGGFASIASVNDVIFTVTDDLTNIVQFPEKSVSSPINQLFNYSNIFGNTGWTFASYNSPTSVTSNYTKVRGKVTTSSCFVLVVSFEKLAPLNQGTLYATVTNLETMQSSSGRVGTIVAQPPDIVASGTVLSSDTASITISGRGFDPNTIRLTGSGLATNGQISQNIVTFSSTDADKTPLGMQTSGTTVSTLVVRFDRLAPQNRGVLNAITDVSDQLRLYTDSYEFQVARIVPAAPTVTTNTTIEFPFAANEVVIQGTGFDSSGWAYMEIAFMQDGVNASAEHILLTPEAMTYTTLSDGSKVGQNTTKFTRSSITLSFSNLYILSVGNLYAAVRTCGNLSSEGTFPSDYCDTCEPVRCNSSSWLYSSGNIPLDDYFWESDNANLEFTQIGLVTVSEPEVTESDAILSSDSVLLTVRGLGFNKNDPADNTMILNASNEETVATSATVSSVADFDELTLRFDRMSACNYGSLYGQAVIKGTSSTIAQDGTSMLAKIVPAASSISDNTNVLSSDSTFLTVRGSGFEFHNSSSVVPNRNLIDFSTLSDSTSISVNASVSASSFTHLVISFTELVSFRGNESLLLRTKSTCCELVECGNVTNEWSENVSVAKIVNARPTVSLSSNHLSSDSLLLTVFGTGFSSSSDLRSNMARFSCDGVCGDDVTALQESAQMDQVVFRFTHLAPTNARSGTTLSATVIVFGTWSNENSTPYEAAIIVSATWSATATPIMKLVAAGPSLKSSSIKLNSDSATITLFGKGFDTISGHADRNVITFYTDTARDIAGIVSDATPEYVTVTFTNPLRPINAGCVNASIIVVDENGDSLTSASVNETVMVVVEEIPILTPSTSDITSASAKLTISGSGFDEYNIENNLVTITSPENRGTAVFVTPVDSTYNSLTLSFNALAPTNWGCCLSASVRTSHASVPCGNTSQSPLSEAQNVSAVVIETPTVTSSTVGLQTNSPLMTIFGSGFDYVDHTVNIVDFTSGGEGAVTGQVINATRSSLIVSFLTIDSTNAGDLQAQVTIQSTEIYRRRLQLSDQNTFTAVGVPVRAIEKNFDESRRFLMEASTTGDGLTSSVVQVAEIVVSAPTIYEDTITLMKTTADHLTIRGFGFSANENSNIVNLDAGTGSIQGFVKESTVSTLIYSFTMLGPQNAGSMTALVTIGSEESQRTQVATMIGCPRLASRTTSIDSDASMISIEGTGFYDQDASKNYITFTQTNPNITADGKAVVVSVSTGVSTPTIVGSFTQLSQHNYGALTATVTVDKSTSPFLNDANADQIAAIGDLDSDPVIVATVNPVEPVIEAASTLLSSDSMMLTIFGSGFSGTNGSTNIITFSPN
eukprot:g2005.t1